MRTQIRGLALLASITAFCAGPVAPQDEGIAWLDNYQEALRRAKQTHKPIFVEFRCEP